MVARPRTERAKLLRLACWNADGVRGRKLELEHFLNQHDVDISLLSEAFLNHNEAFRLANCLPPHRQTDNRGRYSHPGPPWYSPPLSAHSGPDPFGGYRHPGHKPGKPVKICAAYLSPSHPLIVAELSACYGGGIPVLMAGDRNAKHVDWNSRLST